MTTERRQRIYFLHGLLATSYAHFGDQIKRWRESYDVVPLDLPGHGRCRQKAVRPYYESCIAQLRRYMSELGPGHVLGASYLGASAALRCALAAPEGFQSLVLSGYVPNAPHAVVARWTEAFFALAAQDADLVQHYERLHGARWRDTLEVVIAEIRESYSTTIAVSDDMLSTLKVKTLVLNGSLKSDERAAAAKMPSLNPLVDAGIIPGAGHIPSHDQPELFALCVEQFWQRLEKLTVRASVRDFVPAYDASATTAEDVR